MPTAEIGEICDYDRFAAGIAESLPGQRDSLPVRAGQRADVESNPAVSAVGAIDPLLLRAQEVGCINVLQDLEIKIRLAVQVPGMLQVSVVVDFAPQCATMYVPAMSKVHSAPNIDLPVPLAAYPVDTRSTRNGGN